MSKRVLTIILVGWNYQEDQIPVWNDILKVYHWYKKRLTCEYKVIIISDVLERFTDIMSDVILRYAVTCEEILTELLSFVSGDVIFYYSGHGVKDHILLPSNETVSWNSIYELLLRKTRNITIILDCCNSPLFHDLCYRYVSGWNIYCEPEHVERKILVFTPTEVKPSLTAEGSIFTKQLINCFENRVTYSVMELHGILIQSNTAHIPYYDPSVNMKYFRDRLLLQ